MFRFNHHRQGAYCLSHSELCTTQNNKYGPNKICSNTTEATTTMYFN